MPNYQYQCQKCNYILEQHQGFHDKPLRKCPQCKRFQLLRIISMPYISIKGSPRTLFEQAERNTQKMGKYELQEKRAKDFKTHDDAPFWRKKRGINMKLNKLDKTQKQEYVLKGVLPNDKFRPKGPQVE